MAKPFALHPDIGYKDLVNLINQNFIILSSDSTRLRVIRTGTTSIQGAAADDTRTEDEPVSDLSYTPLVIAVVNDSAFTGQQLPAFKINATGNVDVALTAYGYESGAVHGVRIKTHCYGASDTGNTYTVQWFALAREVTV